jgi:enamine deaminase RidA (YjgF/YER057c/UK114 family)
MKRAIKTGLPGVENRPLEWATVADGILYTAQLPLKPDGSFETGDIRVQTNLTLRNLKQTVEAAKGSMADVTQVLVYLTDEGDFAGMNEVYSRYFNKPYPNRATFLQRLVVPGARIEIVAYAHVGQAKQSAAAGKAKRTPKTAKRTAARKRART